LKRFGHYASCVVAFRIYNLEINMKLALYKGDGTKFNAAIRWVDGGIYSHCELVFSDGMSASATYRDDKTVRAKVIDFFPGRWDFIELPESLEADARAFYEGTAGTPYDLLGQVRFVFGLVKGDNKTFWCSEWCAAALGMQDPWRYGPNGLASAVKAHSAWSTK
jgi:hypothetical protein